MIFEWDEGKSRLTFQQRGFDFAYAVRVFADKRRLERVDRRYDYGEERRQTIGEVDRKGLLRRVYAAGRRGADHFGKESP